jgi:hypothetical protein
MSFETTKAFNRRFSKNPVYKNIFRGDGIDIG